MKRLLIFIICAFAMYACKSQKVVTVTEYRDRATRDTVVQTDSVYVSHVIRERGDTIFMLDTLYKFRYLDKVRDVYVHDSVPYTVEVRVPVRTRNGYDKFVSWGFWILLVLALGRFAWWIFKTFYLRR